MMIATTKTLEEGVAHLRDVDPVIAELIDRFGTPPIMPHTRYYQELVESIVSQQLSVKAAATILKRFIGLFEGIDFPAPADILQKSVEEFRSAGLSRQKATYIQDLAVKVIEGTVRFDHLDDLSNDEVITELTQIKGVGVWTVHMFLMFCMGRLNVLPTGDLGIKNGMHRLFQLPEKPSTEEMTALAHGRKWAPYETLASWYIWQSLDNAPKL